MLRNPGRLILNLTLAACTLIATSASSTSYRVLYSLTSKSANPSSGLMTDAQGNAYGTTSAGGHDSAGSVYELSPTTGYHLLYAFSQSGPNGRTPQGNLVMDASGNLYGTTLHGGVRKDHCEVETCGVAFELSPPPNGVGLWTETVIYTFCSKALCADGANPESGVIFDTAGNLYGTTYSGGSSQVGTVFELSPSPNGWTENVLHSFGSGPDDGQTPMGGLAFDAHGNLYGTTGKGGQHYTGTVFELSPVGSGWTETVLYAFGSIGSGDGYGPTAGLAFDVNGNLYGTTDEGGAFSCRTDGCGTVFELVPVGGGWTETIIHNFNGKDGEFPITPVIVDSLGNVYGATPTGGQGCGEIGCGTVFKLTAASDGGWTETVYHFAGHTFGSQPVGPLTLDSFNNVYGTASNWGTNGDGVVFELVQ